MQCVHFVLCQILRESQNIEKFEIVWKKHDFTKDMHSNVSNYGLKDPSQPPPFSMPSKLLIVQVTRNLIALL